MNAVSECISVNESAWMGITALTPYDLNVHDVNISGKRGICELSQRSDKHASFSIISIKWKERHVNCLIFVP